MCFIVLPKPPVQRLVIAALHVQNLLDNGTLTNAWGEGKPDDINTAVAAFDRLQESATALANEEKSVTPFLRYRQEILGHYETAGRLRALVLNLWGGQPVNLGLLFMNADERHTRIALECIVSYATHGENDSHFMGLAAEIIEALPQREEVAA